MTNPTTQRIERLEDLEADLNLEQPIRNEVVINTEKEVVVYVGEANHLHFSNANQDVRGNARLTKYTETELNIISKRISSWIPFKRETTESKKKYRSLVWSVESGNHSYFVHNNETADYYRKDLVNQAAEEGLQFSSGLLHRVFGPIDESLLSQQRQAVRFRHD